MAKNFRILSGEKNSDWIRIHLRGDFDGTSAHELINLLQKHLSSHPKVAINTEGLKRINAFGVDVFTLRLKLLRRRHSRIVFTGRHRSNFIRD